MLENHKLSLKGERYKGGYLFIYFNKELLPGMYLWFLVDPSCSLLFLWARTLCLLQNSPGVAGALLGVVTSPCAAVGLLSCLQTLLRKLREFWFKLLGPVTVHSQSDSCLREYVRNKSVKGILFLVVNVFLLTLHLKVDNTDAEGRLLLADALCYAHNFNARAIVNAATLTGKQSPFPASF